MSARPKNFAQKPTPITKHPLDNFEFLESVEWYFLYFQSNCEHHIKVIIYKYDFEYDIIDMLKQFSVLMLSSYPEPKV